MELEATLGEAGSTATKACSVRADKLTRLSTVQELYPQALTRALEKGRSQPGRGSHTSGLRAPPKVPGSRERQSGVGGHRKALLSFHSEDPKS